MYLKQLLRYLRPQILNHQESGRKEKTTNRSLPVVDHAVAECCAYAEHTSPGGNLRAFQKSQFQACRPSHTPKPRCKSILWRTRQFFANTQNTLQINLMRSRWICFWSLQTPKGVFLTGQLGQCSITRILSLLTTYNRIYILSDRSSLLALGIYRKYR